MAWWLAQRSVTARAAAVIVPAPDTGAVSRVSDPGEEVASESAGPALIVAEVPLMAPEPTSESPAAGGALSAVITNDGAGMPFGEATPLSTEQVGRLLAAAHRELYGVAPGPERLLVAWAHVAHELTRGADCVENNFGNIVVSLRWRGPWHLRRVADQTDRQHARWELQRVRYRSYATPYEGALDYWRFIANGFGSAFRYFDTGEAREAGRTLCERGYSTTSCEAYGEGIRSLYTELRATYAHQLRAIVRHREQPAMQPEDWRELSAAGEGEATTCVVSSDLKR